MSNDPDNFIDDFDEWEVVDVKRTQSYTNNSPKITAVKTKPKRPVTAKKEDVDLLAKQINEQLKLKNKKDEENLLKLQQKIKEQQQISEYTLKQIESKLNQITILQYKQNEQQKNAIKTTNLLTQQQKELTDKINNSNNKNSSNNSAFSNNIGLPNNNANNGGLFGFPNIFWPNNTLNNGNNTNNLNNIPAQQIPQQIPFNNLDNNNSNLNDSNNVNINNPGYYDDNININSTGADIVDDDDGFDLNIWKCQTCNENNDESNKFCPKCGSKNDLLIGLSDEKHEYEVPTKDNDSNHDNIVNIDMNNDDNIVNNIKNVNQTNVLKYMDIVGTPQFVVNEKKQIGWILKNTGKFDKFECNLECLNKNKATGLTIIKDKVYNFTLKNNENIYILMEIIAPCLSGKYSLYFNFTDKYGNKLIDILELNIDCKSKFSKQKEGKIANIVKMGFEDRSKIEKSLKKHKWNVEEAVNELIN